MWEFAVPLYLGAGTLLALRLSEESSTEGWGMRAWTHVVLCWPILLAIGAWPRIVALTRRAELAALTWAFVRVQRRLARLGCTFSIEDNQSSSQGNSRSLGP